MTDPDTNGIPKGDEPPPLTVQVERMTAALADMRAERDRLKSQAAVVAVDRAFYDLTVAERDRALRSLGLSEENLTAAVALLRRIRECVTETGGVYYSSKYLGTDGLIGVWVRDADAFLAHR
jgi:hypothetical protein